MRILVIDDDQQVRACLGRLLRAHTLVLSDGARGALAFLADRAMEFDAIVCDVRMGGMDGAQFHEELERIRPEMLERLVYMTGDAGAPSTRAFLERVERPVVEKPFTREELETILRQVAEGSGAPDGGSPRYAKRDPSSGVHATATVVDEDVRRRLA